jgi:hypothetical protein
MSETILHVLGALALELTPGSGAARNALPQREAGLLAAAMASADRDARSAAGLDDR